jgi:hypothetical protein
MIGFAVNECKAAKIKRLDSLISSTNEDKMVRIDYEELQNKTPHFFIQNGIKKKARDGNFFYEQVESISKKQNVPILIRELPILRQICLDQTDKHTSFEDRWVRFSWNSFFMDEGLHPYDPSYNRWDELQKQYNIDVLPQTFRGDYILFSLQLDGDSALNRLTYNDISYKDYCCDIITNIKQLTDRPILIRSHPLDKTVITHIKSVFGDTINYSTESNIYNDLNRSYCMITYNSTSSVESILYGTPTIVLDPSAVAFSVANSLNNIESLKEYNLDNWLQQIAFMQWQGKELSDGYVWKLLKQTAKLS